MKIALLFPPPGNLSQPYTSLPALTAFMRRAGYTVVQRDLAVEAIEALLAGPQLAAAAARVTARLDELAGQYGETAGAERAALLRVAVSADYVADHSDEARRVLRSPVEFYDLARFRWAAAIVGHALDLASAPYWPSSFSFNHGFTNYVMPGYGWSPQDLLAAAGDARQNVFLDYIRDQAVPGILADAPDLVGISVTYPGQLIPGLTLARQLKALRPGLHVCLGGAVLASMQAELLRSPLLFDTVDSVVVCEGEHALLGLAQALESSGDLQQAPNLLYRDGDRVRFTRIHVEDVNALPSPDYAGLRPELYLTPEITALLPTERGCYWGRCAFCTISIGMRHAYRPRRIDLVIADMQAVSRQLGTRSFFLSTDAISPARMQALARAIVAQGLDFQWQTEARIEKALTPEACRTLARGGCRHLRVGLESGSQPVLDAMHKGLRVADAARVIRDCAEAGISVHTCLILGFPTETRAQARETLDFIAANRAAISSVTYAVFGLYKGSAVYAHPELFGITRMDYPPDDWLNANVATYAVSQGMSPEEARGEAYREGVSALARALPHILPLNQCCMAVAHPLHFFTHWAYLPYLAHYGARHYRELPFAVEMPAPLEAAKAADWRPVLDDAVLRHNGGPHGIALFHPRRAVTASLPREAGVLLSLCDGRATVREAVSKYAAAYPGAYARAYVQGLALCTALLRTGMLRVPEEREVQCQR